MRNVKISGNLMCYNEIDNIKRCIENFLPFVDELLIIDGGSTDGTIEEIKRFENGDENSFEYIDEDGNNKIKLIVLPQGTKKLTRAERPYGCQSVDAQKWNQPYRRNLLIDMALYDWILTKDADEDFGCELHNFLDICDFSKPGYKLYWYHFFKDARKKYDTRGLVLRTDGIWHSNEIVKINLFQKKLICYENVLVHCCPIYKDTRIGIEVGTEIPREDIPFADVPLWHYHYINDDIGIIEEEEIILESVDIVKNKNFGLPKYIQSMI